MQSGKLTVTGHNSTRIPLAGWPHQVIVRFEREPEPVPCNPHHHHDHDKLEYEVIGIDDDQRDHHRPEHHHHDRLFFLVIKWDVSEIREIEWIAF